MSQWVNTAQATPCLSKTKKSHVVEAIFVDNGHTAQMKTLEKKKEPRIQSNTNNSNLYLSGI